MARKRAREFSAIDEPLAALDMPSALRALNEMACDVLREKGWEDLIRKPGDPDNLLKCEVNE